MVHRYETWGNEGKKKREARARRKARGERNNAFSLFCCCYFFLLLLLFFSFFFLFFSSTTADAGSLLSSTPSSTSPGASSPICSRNAEHSRSPGLHVVVARGYHCPARARSRVRDSVLSLPPSPFFLPLSLSLSSSLVCLFSSSSFACHSETDRLFRLWGCCGEKPLTKLSSCDYAFRYNER